MAGFVQIIEFRTSRIEEIEKIERPPHPDSGGAGGFRRLNATADRDQPGTYYIIVEFESYETAMANSSRPEVSEFAAKLAALCDGPPVFRNLDVLWSDTGQGAQAT